MDKKRKIGVEELSDELELQQWEMGCAGFHLILDFSKKQKLTLEDLHVEIEDEYILFDDSKNIFLNTGLSMFTKKSLNCIYYMNINGYMHTELIFKHGNMYIHSIAA